MNIAIPVIIILGIQNIIVTIENYKLKKLIKEYIEE